MADLIGKERERYVREMFGQIAKRYDLMNRLMTTGQDISWRREVIWRLNLPARGRLLDLGTGTGDLAREATKRYPGCLPVGADFSLEMMQVGKERPGSENVAWTAVNALQLPFPDETFHGVVSGFLLRNVSDIDQALFEQWRVLRQGGWMVALDTTRPVRSPISPLISFYLHRVIPILGRLVTGQAEAYTYLPDSTIGFLSAEDLAACLLVAGFRQVGFRRLMFGSVAIHWGRKI